MKYICYGYCNMHNQFDAHEDMSFRDHRNSHTDRSLLIAVFTVIILTTATRLPVVVVTIITTIDFTNMGIIPRPIAGLLYATSQLKSVSSLSHVSWP